MSNLSLKNYLLKYWFLIFVTVLVCSVISGNKLHAESLSLFIETSEGGDISERRIAKLKKYFNANQCPINEIFAEHLKPTVLTTDFVFVPLKEKPPQNYSQVANIKILNDENLSSSILVKSATGITDINNLVNVHIALLSTASTTGYKLPNSIFTDANLKLKKNKITFTETNIASISLLLHGDVFVAAIATPLAKVWAETNNLNIVATSKTIEPGGLWARKTRTNNRLSTEQQNLCTNAFSQLSTGNPKHKKLLMPFPGWVSGFSIN